MNQMKFMQKFKESERIKNEENNHNNNKCVKTME